MFKRNWSIVVGLGLIGLAAAGIVMWRASYIEGAALATVDPHCVAAQMVENPAILSETQARLVCQAK